MKTFLKAVVCLFSLFLSGCYLDINFVGEGRVSSLNEEVDCSQSCRKNSIGKFTDTFLNATPAPGFTFLGFVVQYPHSWATRDNDLLVDYGIAWVRDWFSTTPRLEQRSSRVTAVFWPEDDVRQHILTGNSLCMIDQSSQLHCWGKSAKRFPAENLARLIVDGGGYINNSLCALYNDGDLRCWDEWEEKDWIIPDFITQPLQVNIHGSSMCILHATPTGNAVYCASEHGAKTSPVPTLVNPTHLRTDTQGVICVDDQGDAVCWGGDFYGQATVPADLGPVTDFAISDIHTCAIASGKVRCWGNNEQGQLNVPDDLIAPSAITAGIDHTCVQDSGAIRCWGALNVRLELLEPASFNPNHFTSKENFLCVVGVEQGDKPLCVSALSRIVLPPLPNISAISILNSTGGTWLELSAISDDQLYYGNGVAPAWSNPQQLTQPTLLTSTEMSACTVDAAGLRCWYPSVDGFMPDLTTIPEGLNLQPESLRIRGIAGCAVQNGAAQCWGQSNRGQLDVPAGLPPLQKIDMGSLHTCALSQDQRLFCWGEKPLPVTEE